MVRAKAGGAIIVASRRKAALVCERDNAQRGIPRLCMGQYAHVMRSWPSNGSVASVCCAASRELRNVAALVASRDLASTYPAYEYAFGFEGDHHGERDHRRPANVEPNPLT
jgi:hypothetical protein